MDKIELIKITKLTKDDIRKLVIHSTRSSIRRATDSKPTITIPGDDNVPTLSYIREFNPETREEFYSIHALSSDITRFLLLHSLKNTEEGSEGNA